MINAQTVLNQFAETIGLESIKLNSEGCASLVFGENLRVNFEFDAEEQKFHVYSSLGEIPAEGKEAVYEQLLSANFFGAETGGHSLAINLETRDILLNHTFAEEDLTFENFNKQLESFLPAAEYWYDKLQNGFSKGSSTSTEPLDQEFFKV